MYRLRFEVGGYLSCEVFGVDKADVLERFKIAVRQRAKRAGGKWAEDNIEEVERKAASLIELVEPGVTFDGEPG